MQTRTAHRRAATRARRLPAEERRQQILDAAIDVFARHGYADAGTADIALAAGIGEPTIYRYFANKLELYRAAVQRTGEEVMENWRRIAAENDDPLQALLLVGSWYHQTLTQHPEILQLRFRSMTETHDRQLAQTARETYVGLQRFIEALFAKAKEQGRLSADTDTRVMAWLFMAVGAVMDETQLLGLQDELGPRELAGITRVILEGRV